MQLVIVYMYVCLEAKIPKRIPLPGNLAEPPNSRPPTQNEGTPTDIGCARTRMASARSEV